MLQERGDRRKDKKETWRMDLTRREAESACALCKEKIACMQMLGGVVVRGV